MKRPDETITDIIAEKRRLAEHIRNNPSTVPVRQWDQQAEIKSLEDEADRLEAAHRREVDKLNSAIQATVSHSDAEIDRLRREIAELRQAGSAAKLREAVKAVVDVGYPHDFQHEAPHIRGYCHDITKAIKKCFDALAAEKEGGVE